MQLVLSLRRWLRLQAEVEVQLLELQMLLELQLELQLGALLTVLLLQLLLLLLALLQCTQESGVNGAQSADRLSLRPIPVGGGRRCVARKVERA